AAAHVDELFARNERLACALDGACGRIAVVAVGAYNVGRISAAFDPDWGVTRGEVRSVTNLRAPSASPQTRRYDPPRPVARGDELMTFHLGSTVVLLFEAGRVEMSAALAPGQEVRLGEPIARRTGLMEPAARNRVEPEAG
ncbi:MAG: phosphatidylserine decarboxylase, partial [Longimicrobiales bacterium]